MKYYYCQRHRRHAWTILAEWSADKSCLSDAGWAFHLNGMKQDGTHSVNWAVKADACANYHRNPALPVLTIKSTLAEVEAHAAKVRAEEAAHRATLTFAF